MQRTPDPSQLWHTRDLTARSPGLRPDREPQLTRMRRGVYADRPAGDAAASGIVGGAGASGVGGGGADADPAARDAGYLLRIRAVDAARKQPIFARESALALHGIPYGMPPDVVYTTGHAKTAGKKAGIAHSAVELDPADIAMLGGVRVCSLPYALAEVARKRDPQTAVSAIDEALRKGVVSKSQMLDALGRQGSHGRRRAAWAVAFADAAAESVGESWSRVRIHQLGFAAPELQVWVTGRSGKRYRVDMLWRTPGGRPVFGEFDGAHKYGALAQQGGQTGAQALSEEKARDDDLLFVGDPAHWVWIDVLRPKRLERILTAYRVPRIRPSLESLT